MEIDTRLGELGDENQKLDNRLSFLLEGDVEMAKSFRNEYQKKFLALKNEERELEDRIRQLQLLQRQVAETEDPGKSSGLEQINEAMNYIKKKDFVSLKSLYKKVFKKIIVHPLDSAKVQLEFVFNNISTSLHGTWKMPHKPADTERARKRAIQKSLAKQEVAFCTSVGLGARKRQTSPMSAASGEGGTRIPDLWIMRPPL